MKTNLNSKTSAGIAAFKTKAGMFGSKKIKAKEIKEPPQPVKKEMKPRLFFLQRKELTDVEVIANIGKDEKSKEVIHEFDKLVHTAAMVKKVYREKYEDKSKDKAEPSGLPASILYIGSLKARLVAKAEEGLNDDKEKTEARKAIRPNIKYLGKMKMKKDNCGLYTGSTEEGINADNANDIKDNPVFLALDSMKLKHQVSTESGDSPIGSHASKTGQLNNMVELDEEIKMGEDKVIDALHDGMKPVRPAAIELWNVDKDVRRGRELRPIFIPF